MRHIIFIVALMVSIASFAQDNVTSVLSLIEENNTTLEALRESVKAQKLGNKTDIYLSDPEVEFNYLWGNPNRIGNQNGISVTQTFDIPTIFGIKNRLADNKNQMVDLQYKSDRINILIEAKQFCIELIYYNALKKEITTRLQHAELIEAYYKDRLDQGDANQLEYNKVLLNLSTVRGEMSRVNVEREDLLSQLKRLNGGIDVPFDSYKYDTEPLPISFEDWIIEAEQKSPVLQYIKEQVELSQKEVKLNKAMRYPTFSAGYISDRALGESYQGISVGVSIPLWKNKNKVKQAQANILSDEAKQRELKQQFYNQLQTLYWRARGLQQTAFQYRESFMIINSTNLLKKALDAGEISLLNYILEIALYYDIVNQVLIAERDYQKTLADLSSIEL